MSRARRLAEIAKANEPAFSGSHWWLADPSARSENESASNSSNGARNGHVPVAVADGDARVAVATETAVLTSEAADSAAHTVEAQAPSKPAETEPEPTRPALATRLSSLKEKFLWLGRKSRSTSAE
jgi:hypothetical protein